MCPSPGNNALGLISKAAVRKPRDREHEITMELSLLPVFYTRVGSTATNCLQTLPSKKGSQKVVVGDQDGVVTCFGVSKGVSKTVFKTLPGPAISNLRLGGTPGLPPERIFVSAGAEVRGFSRKGKQFLMFDSNLTEPIKSMWVEGGHLFVCGSYVYNHYVDCEDTDYYLSSDKINSVVCQPLEHTNTPSPVLACQDYALRVLKDSDLHYELEVAGAPSIIALNGTCAGDACEVLYGTDNGKLGLVKLHKDEPEYCWDMLNENDYGGIVSLSCYDVTGSGVPDMLVGREDGVVEVYSFDDSGEPRVQFTHVVGEGVTGVCGGRVSSSSNNELVLSTFSGQVIGLTRDGASRGVNVTSLQPDLLEKIESLRAEISSLESSLSTLQDRYQDDLEAAPPGAVSALPQFSVNNRFTLNQDDGSYTLSIETECPLDTVVLQCDVPVDLQEVDKSMAAVSYTPPDPENNSFLLATFRCQNNSRLEIKIRSIEGQYGTLQVYVTPQLEPKSCRLIQFPIQPLSLHHRVHNFDTSLPINTLHVSGPFTLGEVHSWVSYCLPGVPDLPPSDDKVTLCFRSSFIGTQLECSYQKGEAVFKSENLSTISVVKEIISKQATKKNIAVKMVDNVNDESVGYILRVLYPRLEAQVMVAKHVQLIEPLQEVQIHEGDTSFLQPQCHFILANAESLREEIKRQPSMIERLYALISDLYVDRAALKGQNVKAKVPNLLSVLDACDLDSLLQFFNTN